ncbi:MAG: hypothetical protein CMC05_13295 [Flavobacteriaceae bacterium]|nr:hypothetical protein [Flavobacteriaceae bacterium]|tara:strand:- start:695 stop:1978 length:1284 start_codon:yes stop_codon:yes gene_type:complete
MKKLMTLVLVFTVTAMSFAQKDEVKAIEKALKNSNFANAKSAVSAAEGLIGNMDDKMKAKFLFLKAQALYANGTASDGDIDKAITALEELKNHESSIGKLRYTEDANEMKIGMINSFITKANSDFETKNYKAAAIKFEKLYKMSPKDTTYLYYAASSAVTDQDYDRALDYYIQLKNLGYSGEKMNYYATNKETGEEDYFNDKSTRDFYVKAKSHIKPRDVKSEPKTAEIVKNIALIYVQNGETEKAISAIKDAKEENPNDYNLILSEANIYTKLGNNEKASELFHEALSLDPENPDLNYNVGFYAMNAEQYEDAKIAFKNALKYNPGFAEAALNLSTVIINEGNVLNDEMSSLGNSSADNKKYEELRAQKNEIFTKGAEVLESFIKTNPNSKNIDIYTQLKNIYGALGEMDKFNVMKAKIAEIEAGN